MHRRLQRVGQDVYLRNVKSHKYGLLTVHLKLHPRLANCCDSRWHICELPFLQTAWLAI